MSFPVEDIQDSHLSVVPVEDLPQASISAPYAHDFLNGDKFAGGYGPTKLYITDYWTLRARSAELFKDNLYARGLIRRLVTNEINTGLVPEMCPDEETLGLEQGSLAEWADDIENRFTIWGKNPRVCDWLHAKTFRGLQESVRQEALIEGDILVVLRPSKRTNALAVRLIPGAKVQSPAESDAKLRKGHELKHGVELDAMQRVAAHWVRKSDGDFERIPAWGEKTGRKISWLVYGTDKRMDDIRGEPLLSLIMQSLKDVDRYRDSALRKAVMNSLFAMFIKKTEDKIGSLPLSGAAVRRGSVDTAGDTGSSSRKMGLSSYLPGTFLEELQVGEEPVAMDAKGTDEKFGEFEEAIIQAIAWANEVPPEILRLAFSNNYSASQAAINEFKMYLDKQWAKFGEEFCQPILIEWIVQEALKGEIKGARMLRAWRDPTKYAQFGAWVASDWYGSVKPSTDTLKQARGSQLLVQEGWSTNAREARHTRGTSFRANMKKLKRENEMKVEAMRPLAEFKAEFNEPQPEQPEASIEEQVTAVFEEMTADD